MDHPPSILIADFDYELPDGRIALYPPAMRGQSRLLVWDVKLRDAWFSELPELLPSAGRIISNQTRVLPARMFFRKNTGAIIEILCLEPADPALLPAQALALAGKSSWRCFVGNAKRWKGEMLSANAIVQHQPLGLQASMVSRDDESFVVEFSWHPSELSFGEVLDVFGKMPLPPYIRRQADESDPERYQTVFASQKGSVAAPTAGLHFTPDMIQALQSAGLHWRQITLHVGAGTFKPVTTDNIRGHAMHSEKVDIPLGLIEELRDRPDNFTTLVGTTTARTLESCYIQGLKWMKAKPALPYLDVKQWDAFDDGLDFSAPLADSMDCICKILSANRLHSLRGSTSLMIAPGYKFRTADALITNFHQPGSTLLLLVSAFLGGNEWKGLYRHALDHGYQFLSYGDACLLINRRTEK